MNQQNDYSISSVDAGTSQKKPNKFGQFLLETFTKPEAYASRILPLAAIAESIASKGQGRNYAAEQQQGIYAQAARDRQAKDAEEQDAINAANQAHTQEQWTEEARRRKLAQLTSEQTKNIYNDTTIPEEQKLKKIRDLNIQNEQISGQDLLNYMEKLDRPAAGIGLGGLLAMKKKMWDEVSSMPDDTPEEAAAKQDAISNYYAVTAPGASFNVSPGGIKGSINKTNALAGPKAKSAKQSALSTNSPAVAGAKAQVQSVAQSAKTAQNKLDAGNAAVAAMPPHAEGWTEQNPVYDLSHMTPQISTELAMAQARMLSPTGVISESQTEQLAQGTLDEKLSRAAGFFGYKMPGTTMLNISNIENMINREGVRAQKTLDAALTGNAARFEPTKASGQQHERLSPAEVKAKIASGKLGPGDPFYDVNGTLRHVK